MKNLGKLFAMAVLISAFCVPTFAGGIECGVPTPPPPTSPATAEAAVETSAQTDDVLTEVTLILLEGVLAIF